jgi:hypothetical protein
MYTDIQVFATVKQVCQYFDNLCAQNSSIMQLNFFDVHFSFYIHRLFLNFDKIFILHSTRESKFNFKSKTITTCLILNDLYFNANNYLDTQT